jgi:oxygen-independent coproporphyrinogen-3 oxidase
MILDRELVHKYDVPGPRYTSYPTYPVWKTDFSEAQYRQILTEFGNSDKTLSLYIHLPFCESLCRFCACNVLIRSDIEKNGNRYVEAVEIELSLLKRAVGRKAVLKQLHWGGGTPNYLTPEQIERLWRAISSHFTIDRAGEIAIEVDPVQMTLLKAETLGELGFNRISMGLQDLDPKVQAHVNRIQSYEVTQDTFRWFRQRGITSINVDLIYGLPFQRVATFAKTIEQVIKLAPERIALYSFAWVPWAKKHQRTLDVSALPSPEEKIDIFLMAREKLISKGYEAIAMDHFALSSDEMAIAYHAGSGPVQSHEITRRQDIPKRYLERALQELVRAGVLVGVRGPRGGYRLARERRRISVGEIVRIVRALEVAGVEIADAGGSELGQKVVRPLWGELSENIMARLESVTIEDLCARASAAGVASEGRRNLDFAI